jgi:hypothetical protein
VLIREAPCGALLISFPALHRQFSERSDAEQDDSNGLRSPIEAPRRKSDNPCRQFYSMAIYQEIS